MGSRKGSKNKYHISDEVRLLRIVGVRFTDSDLQKLADAAVKRELSPAVLAREIILRELANIS